MSTLRAFVEKAAKDKGPATSGAPDVIKRSRGAHIGVSPALLASFLRLEVGGRRSLSSMPKREILSLLRQMLIRPVGMSPPDTRTVEELEKAIDSEFIEDHMQGMHGRVPDGYCPSSVVCLRFLNALMVGSGIPPSSWRGGVPEKGHGCVVLKACLIEAVLGDAKLEAVTRDRSSGVNHEFTRKPHLGQFGDRTDPKSKDGKHANVYAVSWAPVAPGPLTSLLQGQQWWSGTRGDLYMLGSFGIGLVQTGKAPKTDTSVKALKSYPDTFWDNCRISAVPVVDPRIKPPVPDADHLAWGIQLGLSLSLSNFPLKGPDAASGPDGPAAASARGSAPKGRDLVNLPCYYTWQKKGKQAIIDGNVVSDSNVLSMGTGIVVNQKPHLGVDIDVTDVSDTGGRGVFRPLSETEIGLETVSSGAPTGRYRPVSGNLWMRSSTGPTYHRNGMSLASAPVPLRIGPSGSKRMNAWTTEGAALELAREILSLRGVTDMGLHAIPGKGSRPGNFVRIEVARPRAAAEAAARPVSRVRGARTSKKRKNARPSS
jgi:hypothetical protein